MGSNAEADEADTYCCTLVPIPIQFYSMRSGLKVYRRSASLIRSNHPRTCKFLQGLLSKMLELVFGMEGDDCWFDKL